MEFLFFVFVIVFIIVVVRMSNKIDHLNRQIKFLDQKISDLQNKAVYNYNRINSVEKNLYGNKNTPPESEDLTENDKNVSAPPVKAQTEVNPYRTSPPSYPSVSKVPSATGSSSVNRNNIPNEIKKNPPVNVQPPVGNVTAARVQPAVQSQPVMNAAPQSENIGINNRPRNNDVSVRNVPRKENGSNEKPQIRSFENWLGTRLFNVAASLMIFIGLILFCTLGYEYITDGMKIAAMFIVSCGFIGLGAFFTRKNKSIFSLGLTGCGFGAFFISVLLSHIYFHAFTDAVSFALLLVWAVFALLMSKKLDSVMLSVTAHMGTAVAICFAFSYVFTNGKIILPVVYQFAALAVIILGNMFCCKKTYRFGLFMSIILLVYTSVVMTSAFSSKTVMPAEISVLSAAVIFGVQLFAESFVSYLISISTAHLESEKAVSEEILCALHIFNKFVWSVGVIVSAGLMTYFALRNTVGITSLTYPTFAVCAVSVIHLFVTLVMTEKLNFSERISKISIWFVSVIVMLSLFVQSVDRTVLHGVSCLFIYVGIIMLIIRYTKTKKLNHLVSFLIGCDMFFMCAYGYFAVENVVVSISYMMVIALMVLLHWYSQSGESKQRRFMIFKITEYLWFSASVIPINVSEFSEISLPLILSEFALINIIAYLCRYAGENEPELKLVVRIESIAALCVNIMFVAAYPDNVLGDVAAIKIIFVILTAVLTALYFHEFMRSPKTLVQVASSVLLSGFVSAAYIGFTPVITNDYINILIGSPDLIPFCFIASAALVVIFRRSGNHELVGFIWGFLGIDMVYKIVYGYSSFIYQYDKTRGVDAAQAFAGVMCVVNVVIISVLIYSIWKYEVPKRKNRAVIPVKIVGYFWVNISMAVISLALSPSYIWGDVPFAVLTAINIAVYISKYHVCENRFVKNTIRIGSSVVIYLSIIAMAHHIINNEELIVVCYSTRFILILLSVGLYYLVSRELIKMRSPLIHSAIGLTGTLIVNSSCEGLSDIFNIAYIFSIVTMITALICIVVGFAIKSKGLRIYGLIVIMLCVIKLVTFDISGADSISRVVAFIVGGIVCFVISGIYNMFENRLIREESGGSVKK